MFRIRTTTVSSLVLALMILAPPATARAELGTALSVFNDGLGFIANLYGAYQAFQFVEGLAANPNPMSEVETYITSRGNSELTGNVHTFIERLGDVQSMLANNPNLDLNSELVQNQLADILTFGEAALNQMISIVHDGHHYVDALQLALPINIIAPVVVNVKGLMGIGVEQRNLVLQNVLQIDYEIAGAWGTSANPAVTDRSADFSPYSRRQSIFWSATDQFQVYPAFRPSRRGGGALWVPAILGFNDKEVPACNLNYCTRQSDSDCNFPSYDAQIYYMLRNQAGTEEALGYQGYLHATGFFKDYVYCSDSEYYARWQYTLPKPTARTSIFSNEAFNRRPHVAAVEIAMTKLMELGFRTVKNSNGDTIDISNPIGNEQSIAMTGVSGWATVPIGFPHGDGGYSITNNAVDASNFPFFAARARFRISGDFDGDGYDDIAIIGGSMSSTIHFARSYGRGQFTESTYWSTPGTPSNSLPSFNSWANTPSVFPVVGDFNGDGRDDIALLGKAGAIPVAYSAGTGGTGSFSLGSGPSGDFVEWAALPGVQGFSGDFDFDGVSDIALIGGPNWNTVPVAFGSRNGTFVVTNTPNAFAQVPNSPGAHTIVGDFNGDGASDLAIVDMYENVSFLLSQGDGSFWNGGWANPRNGSSPPPPSPAQPLAGDFNGDGLTDFQMWAPSSFESVYYSNGDGTFTLRYNTTMANVPQLAEWSGEGGSIVVGRFSR